MGNKRGYKLFPTLYKNITLIAPLLLPTRHFWNGYLMLSASATNISIPDFLRLDYYGIILYIYLFIYLSIL